MGHIQMSENWSSAGCSTYIVDSVDERVDAAVAHGQDVARHPHVVDACEAEKLRLFSVPNTEMREEP